MNITSETVNVIELPARKSNDWISPEELRALLKKNLGLNARKVSVKVRSSLSYITITIRDAAVSVDAVKQFAKTFNSWSMDNTDYCTGQSISVDLSEEVRETLARSVLHIIAACQVPATNQGTEIVPGVMLWNDGRNVWLERRTDRKRSCESWTEDLARKSPDTVKNMALNLALLTQAA